MGATNSPADQPIEIFDEGDKVTQVKNPLCEFPPGESPTVWVNFKDYETLQYDTWLNDIIIDFFLAWLYRKVLQEEDRARVHMFTTMFYRFAVVVFIFFLI